MVEDTGRLDKVGDFASSPPMLILIESLEEAFETPGERPGGMSFWLCFCLLFLVVSNVRSGPNR